MREDLRVQNNNTPAFELEPSPVKQNTDIDIHRLQSQAVDFKLMLEKQ